MNNELISDTGLLARVEIDSAIATAKSYPRDVTKFVDECIYLATIDQETAESCFYCLVRNGKDGKSEIKGPSIRLAEIVMSCWGNIKVATRIVENDGKFITAEGICIDLQKNITVSMPVKRKITTKTGMTYSDDMQAVTGNAACSIALRNAIFRTIPKALVDRVYEAAIKFSVGDQKTIEAKRKSVFDRFNKLGIETKKILGFYGKDAIDEFGEKELIELIGVGTAIKDGMMSIDKAFSMDVIESDNPTEDRLKHLTA